MNTESGSTDHGERRIRVFIENEAGVSLKNLHDERTLTRLRSQPVARPYPYPYGFVLETRNEDGDNLDCYVLTTRQLRRGDIVECMPIALMEQMESGQQDHNVLAVLPEEPRVLDRALQEELTEFVLHVFDNVPGRMVTVGRFLSTEHARRMLLQCEAARRR